MKRHDDNLRDVFDRHMPPAAPGVLEDAAERVLRGLRERSHHQEMEETKEQAAVSRLRYGPRFAVAATLVVAVAIGAYAAYRGGFWSRPQVVLPAAQSPAASGKAAAETTQAAAAIPGSTKPALSREEVLTGVAAQIAAAQSTDAGAARPKFAVASVRPVPMSPLVVNGFKCLGIDGLWVVVGGAPVSPAQGRCAGDVVDPSQLVYAAYSSSSRSWTPLSRITGIPPRLADLSFQINAVADNPERVTKGELKLMLQTLLEDRFKARVHLETREVDGYVLTVAKSGIKFKETSGDQSCGVGDASPKGKCRMETLSTWMTLRLGYLPIADKTGLTGIYDINLSLEEIPMGGPAPTRGAGGVTPPPRQFTTPLPKAVEDQLGLQLERGKVPVEYVVVDHIEALTDN
jgi:uncharacterized protein (TIGR03435 family)